MGWIASSGGDDESTRNSRRPTATFTAMRFKTFSGKMFCYLRLVRFDLNAKWTRRLRPRRLDRLRQYLAACWRQNSTCLPLEVLQLLRR